MAYGDVGGAVTALVITCQCDCTRIAQENPVFLSPHPNGYRVSLYPFYNGQIPIGQALSGADEGFPLPVRVHGISRFTLPMDQVQKYHDELPFSIGWRVSWVKTKTYTGLSFKKTGTAFGAILKVDKETGRVDILH